MSSFSGPPDFPVLCLDEALGGRVIAARLRALGLRVRLLRDHFRPGTPDAVWIRALGKRGWVFLSKDKHIRKRVSELVALRRGSARAFILTSGDITAAQMADAFERALPRMRRILETTPSPFIANVTRNGTVCIVYP